MCLKAAHFKILSACGFSPTLSILLCDCSTGYLLTALLTGVGAAQVFPRRDNAATIASRVCLAFLWWMTRGPG